MTPPNWQIVIAERGWIYVGRTSREGDLVVITDAQNVRRWGTSKGLGELSANGPLAKTQLDPYGTVRIHVLAVIGALDCNDAIWDAWLAKQGCYPQKAKRK